MEGVAIIQEERACAAADLGSKDLLLVTVTYPNGLSENHIKSFKLWLEDHEYALGNLEKHKSGAIHAHAIINGSKGSNKRRSIINKVFNKEKLSSHALNVKKVGLVSGAITYVMKDCTGEPWVLKGFTLEGIKEMVSEGKREHLKRKPEKLIGMSASTAAEQIAMYAKEKGVKVQSKSDFARCLCAMSMEGFDILPIRKHMPFVFGKTIALINQDYRALYEDILNQMSFTRDIYYGSLSDHMVNNEGMVESHQPLLNESFTMPADWAELSPLPISPLQRQNAVVLCSNCGASDCTSCFPNFDL